jgi:hypothetical protein
VLLKLTVGEFRVLSCKALLKSDFHNDPSKSCRHSRGKYDGGGGNKSRRRADSFSAASALGYSTAAAKFGGAGVCFRGNAICNILSKAFESCILGRFQYFLLNKDHHFGFKKGLDCNHFISTVRTIIEHFTKGSSLYR